jgi:hypothetical protein
MEKTITVTIEEDVSGDRESKDFEITIGLDTDEIEEAFDDLTHRDQRMCFDSLIARFGDSMDTDTLVELVSERWGDFSDSDREIIKELTGEIEDLDHAFKFIRDIVDSKARGNKHLRQEIGSARKEMEASREAYEEQTRKLNVLIDFVKAQGHDVDNLLKPEEEKE